VAARRAPDVRVASGDERVSPALKICETRELLAEQYRMEPAPDPSRELLAWMNIGPFVIASKEAKRDDVLVPLAPRRARRLRYLVAATVASAFAMSGLAAAGALPASLQRAAASVASVVSVDLPTPAAVPTPDVRNPRAPQARRGLPTHPHAVPASPPVVDTGAGAVAGTPPSAFPPGAEPGASAVDSIPDPTVPPPSDLPTVAPPAPAVPELQPAPVPSSANSALPVIPPPDPLLLLGL
jgi:hypothetical protein